MSTLTAVVPAPPYTPVDPDVVDILEFTDPVCVWCWGSEPTLRALKHQYGDQVRIGFVMGGLVPDINTFMDARNNIGGGPEQSNRAVAAHWLQAAERHGMPIGTEGFGLFSDEHRSTYPQNIAYKAAQQQGEELATRFLRRMREASEVEAMVTSTIEVQTQLAAEVGLDVGALLKAVGDGSAEAAFHDDQAFIRGFGSTGFPAFLIRYRGKAGLLPGWQPFETFAQIIESFTNGQVQPHEADASDDAALAFIAGYDRVAPIEVATALNLSKAATAELLDRLVLAGRVTRTPAGNGSFIKTAPIVQLCDTVTGMCLPTN